MRELWALLNFLEPGQFGAADEFEAAYRVDGAAVSVDLHGTPSNKFPALSTA